MSPRWDRWRLPVEGDKRYLGGARVRRGRPLYRGRATARPSPQAVSARSGHDRSAENIGGHAVCPLPSRQQSILESPYRLRPSLPRAPRLKGLINAFFLCLIFRRPASRLKPANFNFDQNLPAQILHMLFDSDLFNKNQHLRNHQSRARGEGKLYSAAARAPPEWAETM